jgi:alkylation response protein AidB-like acyl-CoA dehydrogenase
VSSEPLSGSQEMLGTSDQDLFWQTTAKFLLDQVPAAEIRRLRQDARGFDPSYWRSGAQLGWVSLLVPEELGGGTISGQGVVDLSLVAHEFGRRAAPGPLLGTNVVASALGECGSTTHVPVIADLVSGEQIATWCYSEPPPDDQPGDLSLEVRVQGGEVVLNGVKQPVEFAGQAAQLLVTGRSDNGLTQVRVPAGTPGVRIDPMETIDLTKRFFTVTFDQVRIPLDLAVGELDRAADDVERQLQLALVIIACESVGAMQTAFDMTVEWAFDRYTFGRPLASYQELKHRFADMKTWLEASHAITDAAVDAVQSRSADAGELSSAAKAFVGDYGAELVQDCVQIHGGIGLTFDHDLHLYLRRVVANRAIFGTPADHRKRLARLLSTRAESA